MKVKSESEVTLRVWLFSTPWTAAYQTPLSMDFPGKSTGVGAIAFSMVAITNQLKLTDNKIFWSLFLYQLAGFGYK